jgi:NADH:ubiquinone oxidoreductase subunit K
MLTLELFLLISIVMFAIGIYGIISRRNMVRILLSAEVIFNAALLALIALSTTPNYLVTDPTKPAIGGIISLFAIGLAAAEIGVTMAIAILLFKIKNHLDVYELRRFKG